MPLFSVFDKQVSQLLLVCFLKLLKSIVSDIVIILLVILLLFSFFSGRQSWFSIKL